MKIEKNYLSLPSSDRLDLRKIENHFNGEGFVSIPRWCAYSLSQSGFFRYCKIIIRFWLHPITLNQRRDNIWSELGLNRRLLALQATFLTTRQKLLWHRCKDKVLKLCLDRHKLLKYQGSKRRNNFQLGKWTKELSALITDLLLAKYNLELQLWELVCSAEQS